MQHVTYLDTLRTLGSLRHCRPILEYWRLSDSYRSRPWLWPWFSPQPCARTGPHSDTILVRRGLLTPPLPRRVPFFVDPSWPHLSTLSLACLVPSSNADPPPDKCLLCYALVVHPYRSVWSRGTPLPPLSVYFLIFPRFLLFFFFHWLCLFSSFVHPFPIYQNSPTPFPGRRS